MKPDGGEGYYAVPSELGWMTQHFVNHEIENIYDGAFSDYKYDFIKGRNAPQALEVSLDYINSLFK